MQTTILKTSRYNCSGSYVNIQFKDRYLYVYDSPISCGMKLIDGIEEFFVFENVSKENILTPKKDFIEAMKYIIYDIKAAFYLISYRENLSYFRKHGINEFLDTMFIAHEETVVNPNSDNEINIKIASRDHLLHIIYKLEKELNESSSSNSTLTSKIVVGNAF